MRIFPRFFSFQCEYAKGLQPADPGSGSVRKQQPEANVKKHVFFFKTITSAHFVCVKEC